MSVSLKAQPAKPSRAAPGLSRIASGQWLPLLVVLALIVAFAVLSPPFLSWRNFSAITGEAATLLIASLGASFVVLMGGIDLSVGAIVLQVGSASVTLMTDHDYGLLVLPLGALLGIVLGTANGLVCVVGRV